MRSEFSERLAPLELSFSFKHSFFFQSVVLQTIISERLRSSAASAAAVARFIFLFPEKRTDGATNVCVTVRVTYWLLGN